MRKYAKPSVVDLFAGAGLLTWASASERFQVMRAIEQNSVASETYRNDYFTRILTSTGVPAEGINRIVYSPGFVPAASS